MSIYLKRPTFEELEYRQHLLANENTMSYNAGYNLSMDTYDYQSGTIEFKKEHWQEWYDKWMSPQRFYAYIVRESDQQLIGDVAFQYIAENQMYGIHILIEHSYRNMGYSEAALKALLEVAFYEYGLEQISDDIPKNRVSAHKLFEKIGFKSIEEHTTIRFGKEEKTLLFVITKKQYEKMKNSI